LTGNGCRSRFLLSDIHTHGGIARYRAAHHVSATQIKVLPWSTHAFSSRAVHAVFKRRSLCGNAARATARFNFFNITI